MRTGQHRYEFFVDGDLTPGQVDRVGAHAWLDKAAKRKKKLLG